MSFYLRAIDYILPPDRLTNDDLVKMNPSWNAASIFAKTGIRSRPVTAPGETAADLGCQAVEKLFQQTGFDRSKIDAILFCTQSADYYLPTSACLMQSRLKLSTSCAAFDVNLGCSGFTYSLWIAGALIESGSASNVLVIAGDTFAKYCNPHDIVTATIFADGAAAVLLTRDSKDAMATIGPTVLGTDGRGGEYLIVRDGGARRRQCDNMHSAQHSRPEDAYLFMNGPEVFSFTLNCVPGGIQRLLERVNLLPAEVDHYLFHQANCFMLNQLRMKVAIPPEKFPIDLEDIGNTAGASLPILIKRCIDKNLFKAGEKCILVGFGVGFSWAVTYMEWGVRPAVAK
ncbi:MAG: ketoacyl-ACP synthase III [Thermoguttaceae bacterium]|jgi:3-oxoacyl-[acyl-carrier-protein] synthase-3